MANLLRKMKAPEPKRRKMEFDTGLSDSSGDELGPSSQRMKAWKVKKEKTRGSRPRSSSLSSDSDDDANPEDNLDQEKEIDGKSKADQTAAALLAGIQVASPDDDSKVQSRRGKQKRGNVESKSTNKKSNKYQDLLDSYNADEKERQRRDRIRELEERQNNKDGDEVIIEHIALPKILTASEREGLKPKRSSIETIDLLTTELGASASSDAIDTDTLNVQGGLTVKTRLNGSHMASFKLAPNSNFGVLVKQIISFYGLDKQKGFISQKNLKLQFDGQTLSEGGTPEDEDMDDGDLVDVTVDGKYLDAAVNSVESDKLVKFKTRMNGDHVHKWRVRRCENFGSIKGKFAHFYGLQLRDVTHFNIDGEHIGDDETPESLDMEDDDLIDATVPQSEYEAAVKFVTSEPPSIATKLLSPPVSTAKKKASERKENRVKMTFHVMAAEEITCSGKPVESSITVFADQLVKEFRNQLVTKEIVRNNVQLSFSLLKNTESKNSHSIDLEKSLLENGVVDNSTVQIHRASIAIRISPVSLSADGKTNFVNDFLVTVNPRNALKKLLKELIKSKHLIFSREQLVFTLVHSQSEGGVPVDLDDTALQDMSLNDIGFYNDCEIAVGKKSK